MIRIKVFPLKKIIYKLEIILAYISFLILILLLVSLLVSRKTINTKEVLSSKLVLANSKTNNNLIEKIVKSKIKILSNFEYDNKDFTQIKEQNNEYTIIDSNIKNEEIEKQEEKINIDVVEYNTWNRPKEYETKLYENGKVLVGNTTINNYTKRPLNLEELKKPSNFLINDETSFLIFHTHTSETYTIDSSKYSDFYRTEDENYNILSVGKVLADSLKNKGYYSVQDKTVHDYPNYNSSYKASLETVQKQMNSKKYDFVIDIHRDAVSSNYNFRPTVEINGESSAKLMFVIGTNAAGLSHDEWMENLKLAIMIQNRANEMYPRTI